MFYASFLDIFSLQSQSEMVKKLSNLHTYDGVSKLDWIYAFVHSINSSAALDSVMSFSSYKT